jgi:hypothetical protein
MVGSDFELRALRRRFLVGIWSFVIAFCGLLGLVTYLILRFVVPERGWLESVVWFLQSLVWTFCGAMLIGTGMIELVEWPYVLRGRYRCPHCGRPSPRLVEICPCMPAELRVKGKSRYWMHYRRQIPRALLTCGVVLAVTLVAFALHPIRRDHFAVDVIAAHAALCLLLGIVIEGIGSVLEMLRRGRRFRIRARMFLQVLLSWPLVVAVMMICWKATSG